MGGFVGGFVVGYKSEIWGENVTILIDLNTEELSFVGEKNTLCNIYFPPLFALINSLKRSNFLRMLQNFCVSCLEIVTTIRGWARRTAIYSNIIECQMHY